MQVKSTSIPADSLAPITLPQTFNRYLLRFWQFSLSYGKYISTPPHQR